MLANALRVQSQQRQAATPRLQQAVRLLQLSSQDFAQQLVALAASNPFLDLDDAKSDAESDAAADDDAVDEWVAWGQASVVDRATSGQGEFDLGALDHLPARADLRALLTAQIRWLRLSPRDHALAWAVIESLDDDGYLRTGLGELAAVTGLLPTPDACEMNTALLHVQHLDPAGVGARDLAECLLLQLGQQAADDAAPLLLAMNIVRHHLPQLASHDTAGLARALGVGAEQVAAAGRLIRRLDPRPGWRCAEPSTRYLTPDVIVRKLRGAWRAQLNPAITPRLRVNTLYADMFERHRDAGQRELANHLTEARWMVRNVEQRLDTITAVAQAIVKRQHGFLEFGALAMRPLVLRDIATEVGIHESTVCRVTNNKFMATPAGVFELKYFFSRAMPTDSGGACSAIAIRSVISKLIESESRADPLSDVEITRRLNRQGVPVARRTVTKYRQGLRLPAAEVRRCAALAGP